MSMQTPTNSDVLGSDFAKSKEIKPFSPSFSVSNQTKLAKNTDTSLFQFFRKKQVPYFAYFSNQTFKQASEHPDKNLMQDTNECACTRTHTHTQLLFSFQIRSYLSPEEGERTTHRLSHSYAHVLPLHFSVQFKCFIRCAVFLRRKSRTVQRSCGCPFIGSIQDQV